MAKKPTDDRYWSMSKYRQKSARATKLRHQNAPSRRVLDMLKIPEVGLEPVKGQMGSSERDSVM